jgi:hypothetical protein
MQKLLAIVCVSFGCVSLAVPEQSNDEQSVWGGGSYDPDGEVIVIEGGWDSCLDGKVCWGDLDEDPIDWGDTGGYGGGGGPGGGPGDQPKRKNCKQEKEKGLDACLDCCFYNHDKVDGWRCRKIKDATKREKCWKDAVEEQSRCQVEDCGRDRPIITTGSME